MATTSPEQDLDQLVIDHLYLVPTALRRFAGRVTDHQLEDLHSEGLVGLVQAARRYVPSNRSTFATYATHRVLGAMRDSIRTQNWVKRHTLGLQRRTDNAMERVEQRLGRHWLPDDGYAELAAELGVSESKAAKLHRKSVQLEAQSHWLSFNYDGGESGDIDLHEVLADPGPTPAVMAEHHDLNKYCRDFLASNLTTPHERKAIELYYNQGMTLKEVAAEFGVTESRACQLHTSALVKLRKHLFRLENALPPVADDS